MSGVRDVDWPADQLDHFLALVARGRSAGQIVTELRGPKRTRSAICGKATRVGVKLKGKAETYPENRRAAPQRVQGRDRPKPITIGRAPASPTDPTELGKPFGERRAWQCSWIISDDGEEPRQCCERIDRRSWCAHHASIGLVSVKGAEELARSLRRHYG